ncbi:alpha/beta hydrolase [Flavobacterium sp.]|uniref:alpha/beta hydrolase n=1 Tax=Flavobacterium sp. TaxID=239 RepID=UPI003527C344
MNKIILSTIVIFTSFLGFTQNTNYQIKSRPVAFESVETINDSIVSYKTTTQNLSFTSKLPYPILFIHGLNSDSNTWNNSINYLENQYGFTFGGRFDFCLNGDNNDAVANVNIYPTANADIIPFELANMQNGDYYLVNYKVNVDGSLGNSVLSNQAAIVKQGKALQVAVNRVMQLTGKNKVILVGHSMGGLASREYIQNNYNWQPDNLHHVAKLLTLGTPHGGSNASDLALGFFVGIDTHSEAIRDLKITYYYSGDQGRYLFGGLEVNDSNNMNEHLWGDDFFNIDVNCNGATGDNVLGLNQKSIDNLIDFTNVVGKINGSATDGVVTETSAKMNNYLTGLQFPAKYFYYTSIGVENHTALPNQYYQIMQGLDEPNFNELAYEVATNTEYYGFTTVQENSANADNDFYKFSVSDEMITTVTVNEIATSQLTVQLLDNAGNTITPVTTNTGNAATLNATLAPGDYFLKIVSTAPSNTDYQTPYVFSINTTLETTSFTTNNEFIIYPNPFNDYIAIENGNFAKGEFYTINGQKVLTFTTETKIATSQLAKGTYVLVLTNNNGKVVTKKVVKE